MSPKGAAWVTLAVLVVGLVGAIGWSTPWRPLGPVASQDRVAVDPAADFTAAEAERAEEYRGKVRVPGYAALAVSLAVTLLLGLTTLGASLVTALARPLGGGWGWQVLAGGLGLLLVVRLVTLPFGAWAESLRRGYGLSTRNWGDWLLDVVKGFGINAVLTLGAVLVLVALARAMPRWWWAPAALGAAGLVLVVSFLYPLLVEPVFNRFTPMPDGPLRSSLLQLAEADGIDVEDVLVADASRRTTTLNAYVSGFGGTRRIVVYDTLLEQAPQAEVEIVVAHELGHVADRDVLSGTLLGALGAAASVVALSLALAWTPLLARAGVTGPGDARVIALVLALAAVGGLLASPVSSLVSRRVEARADVHALDLTSDPRTFVAMQRRLALTSLADLTPNPVAYVWFASHPTAPQRNALARTWAGVNDQPVPPPLVSEAETR